MAKTKTTDKTAKRLTVSMAIIFLLCICLCITSSALVYSVVSVENNLFVTGTVNINLNDGQPVIEENEFLFEPGMTVVKEFFVENESSCDVYYKLYFQNVNGDLADVLQVSVRDGEQVLFSGTARTMSRQSMKAAEDALRIGERRQLQIWFHFPEAAGNSAQNAWLTFDFAADAVQTKNNTDRTFD